MVEQGDKLVSELNASIDKLRRHCLDVVIFGRDIERVRILVKYLDFGLCT